MTVAPGVSGPTRIPLEALTLFVADVLDRCGVPAPAAADAAEVLCYADAVGLDTHGAINLERIYVPRLLDGEIDGAAEPRIIVDARAAARMDGRRSLGLVVGVRALDEAVQRARRFGVGAVAVSDSSHLGSAGYYAARAMRRGMVAIVMTNLGGQRIAAAPGGSAPLLGTNPIAAGAPASEHPDFLLDMSTTVVSTGRIRQAQRRGSAIPPGWLADAAGRPLTDPASYDAGTGHLQWLGGNSSSGAYKGFGLGLLVEVLCGVLAGAQDAPSAPEPAGGGPPDLNVGHFFLALDPGAFGDPAAFGARMDRMLGAVLAVGASYPGCPESATSRERRAAGVPLDADLAASLRGLAERLELTPPWPSRCV